MIDFDMLNPSGHTGRGDRFTERNARCDDPQ